ncbi:DUF2531 domain-containing protein [Erwinia aphidicola]|uniref:DUF2531 domain-containing protein n=1 Tax=Erwinia aphidicola TaxID=68334 RepID=UPI0030CA9BAD
MLPKLALLLLLLASGSHARDPFFLQESRCQPATGDAPAGWRLLGIVGRPGHYHAWLRSPLGSTLHAQIGDALPATAWQLAAIDWLSASLSPSQDCPPVIKLTLKGQQNAQDALPLAGADQPALTGAGAAVTGVR